MAPRRPRPARALLLALLASALLHAPAAAAAQALPVSGREVPELAPFDDLFSSYLATSEIPGAGVAIMRQGRLIYARGFGYADASTGAPVSPDALFRIASISKPITAVAVLQLAEAGKLKLGDKVVALLGSLPEPRGDRRLRDITVWDLLHHSAGWDRERSFDPMFRSQAICAELHIPPPAAPRDIIAYMWGRKLDFAPGSAFAYSNFGYCLLGRIIEQASGMGYGDYVREHVLKPIGIERMRLGKTRLDEADAGEVHYYAPKEATAPSVFPASGDAPVPLPYGGFCLESMDAHGGWLASAPDLARFAAAFAQADRCPVLGADQQRLMFSRPAGAFATATDGSYYACGWKVRLTDGDGRFSAWHTGSLPGTSTLLVRRWDGLCWAVLFNSRDAAGGVEPAAQIDGLMHEAAAKVKRWP